MLAGPFIVLDFLCTSYSHAYYGDDDQRFVLCPEFSVK